MFKLTLCFVILLGILVQISNKSGVTAEVLVLEGRGLDMTLIPCPV